MPRLKRVLLAEVLVELRDMTPLDPTALSVGQPDDLLLCALGFEERCLTLPVQLKEAGFQVRRAAYWRYSTNLDDNAVNQSELEAHLSSMAEKVDPIETTELRTSTGLRPLLEAVTNNATGPPRVTLDVSVMTNQLILQSLKVLLEYDVNVRIIYAEAAVYHPTRSEYEADPDMWEGEDGQGLARGVGSVTPSAEYPGYALDQLPDMLLMFPGFRAERSNAVVSFVDPSLVTNPGDKVIWLLGIPHLDENRWRLDAMRRINSIDESTPQYEVSTFDYKDTIRVLEDIYSARSRSHTLTLSPLGSKMQAVGTALFCFMHPDVRIIFSTPKEYNATHYSRGCRALWTIDLGLTRDLRHMLSGVGSLTIEG